MTDSPPDKTALRREGLARRDAVAPAEREAASRSICEKVLALPEVGAARIVAGYWPMRSEVDPRPALEALAARGTTLALPAVEHPVLAFRRWRPGDALVLGAFGVAAPESDSETVYPDLLMVPLARFDRACHRIGYGKGHYDRAIAALAERGRVFTIGLAFGVQEAPAIPAEDHDRRLDCVVTERGCFRAPAREA